MPVELVAMIFMVNLGARPWPELLPQLLALTHHAYQLRYASSVVWITSFTGVNLA
jgi:hypothetical protein